MHRTYRIGAETYTVSAAPASQIEAPRSRKFVNQRVVCEVGHCAAGLGLRLTGRQFPLPALGKGLLLGVGVGLRLGALRATDRAGRRIGPLEASGFGHSRLSRLGLSWHRTKAQCLQRRLRVTAEAGTR